MERERLEFSYSIGVCYRAWMLRTSCVEDVVEHLECKPWFTLQRPYRKSNSKLDDALLDRWILPDVSRNN